jgi:hypothetical protein
MILWRRIVTSDTWVALLSFLSAMLYLTTGTTVACVRQHRLGGCAPENFFRCLFWPFVFVDTLVRRGKDN